MAAGSLEFMLVRLEDDGIYTCIVSNAAGNVTRTVTLQIQGKHRQATPTPLATLFSLLLFLVVKKKIETCTLDFR
jgi:hypothetical protein